MGFPGGSEVKNLPVNPGDFGNTGLIPGWGRFPRGGNSNPPQYYCLENPMDRGAWQITTVHSIAELDMTEHIHTCMTYLRQRFKSLTKLLLITLSNSAF